MNPLLMSDLEYDGFDVVWERKACLSTLILEAVSHSMMQADAWWVGVRWKDLSFLSALFRGWKDEWMEGCFRYSRLSVARSRHDEEQGNRIKGGGDLYRGICEFF